MLVGGTTGARDGLSRLGRPGHIANSGGRQPKTGRGNRIQGAGSKFATISTNVRREKHQAEKVTDGRSCKAPSQSFPDIGFVGDAGGCRRKEYAYTTNDGCHERERLGGPPSTTKNVFNVIPKAFDRSLDLVTFPLRVLAVVEPLFG